MASFNLIGDFEDEESGLQTLPDLPDSPQEEEPEQDVEDMLSEAERRFSKAKYYEVLIKEPIFNDDTSPMALEVVKEIQTYSRERLSILLGLKQERENNTAGFTKQEVEVLKKVASKLTKKPELAGIQNSNPSLKKVSAPSKPEIQQVRKSPGQKEAKKPTMKPEPKKGKTLDFKNKDGSVTKYQRVTDGDKEYFIGPNNQRYTLGFNANNESYMKALPQTAPPAAAPKPLPPITQAGMEMLASRTASIAERMNEANLKRGGTTDSEYMSVSNLKG